MSSSRRKQEVNRSTDIGGHSSSPVRSLDTAQHSHGSGRPYIPLEAEGMQALSAANAQVMGSWGSSSNEGISVNSSSNQRTYSDYAGSMGYEYGGSYHPSQASGLGASDFDAFVDNVDQQQQQAFQQHLEHVDHQQQPADRRLGIDTWRSEAGGTPPAPLTPQSYVGSAGLDSRRASIQGIPPFRNPRERAASVQDFSPRNNPTRDARLYKKFLLSTVREEEMHLYKTLLLAMAQTITSRGCMMSCYKHTRR